MATPPALILKPGKERSVERRHPWIYAAAIARIEGSPGNGDLVAVRAGEGRFLAWAAYSPASNIRARCWTYEQDTRVDARWIATRVRAAVARRQGLLADSDALRLVFGEADALPGLVADRYADFLVLQVQSAGVEAHRETILEALCDSTGCANVFDRSDAALRAREGLGERGGVLRGAAPPAHVQVQEHGVRFQVDVRRGHKTGFYIDQRVNRHLLAQWVAAWAQRHGRAPRVLNCFCYTGGFSIAAQRAGASDVVSVDSSADALELARANARLNGIAAAMHWDCGDVFERLRALREAGERFDIVVLDPPKFATNQHQVERAARAYKDINLSALRLLGPGGLLATFSCSAAIDADLFQKIVAGAVIDAGVDCLLRARLGAGPDHPVLMTHPEGEYLKGLLLERR